MLRSIYSRRIGDRHKIEFSLACAISEPLLGNAKSSKVESLTKHGKLVAYEAKVLSEGKKSEVQVGRMANHRIKRNEGTWKSIN
jgi:hypothetical protein